MIVAQLQLLPAVRADKSTQICQAITADRVWHEARTVALFAPQPSEPDVELLWRVSGGKSFCYPRVHNGALAFFRVEDPTMLRVEKWTLREPPADPGGLVELAALDLVLVPGVAFTTDGRRLGRGGGYYDRLLAHPAMRAWKCGICFALQLVDTLPVEPHDVRMDAIFSA